MIVEEEGLVFTKFRAKPASLQIELIAGAHVISSTHFAALSVMPVLALPGVSGSQRHVCATCAAIQRQLSSFGLHHVAVAWAEIIADWSLQESASLKPVLDNDGLGEDIEATAVTGKVPASEDDEGDKGEIKGYHGSRNHGSGAPVHAPPAEANLSSVPLALPGKLQPTMARPHRGI